jgi:hypothetical protein
MMSDVESRTEEHLDNSHDVEQRAGDNAAA